METRRGRKPLAERKLTFAEAKRRQRMKDKLLREEMDKHGYMPVRVFMHPKQLEALSYIDKRTGGEEFDIVDTTRLSFCIFQMARDFIENNSNNLDDGESLQKLIESEGLPTVSTHKMAKVGASLKFSEWSKKNIEGLK